MQKTVPGRRRGKGRRTPVASSPGTGRRRRATAALLAAALAGCAAPAVTPDGVVSPGYGANAGYFALDPATAEANRQNTNRVEQEARDLNHVERMRQAQATEVATRHNPTSVSTTTVWLPWW